MRGPCVVHAIGARLSDEIAPDQYNYGQLQVVFDDDSVGWYEAAWGPQISEVAFFVKDIMGPQGRRAYGGRGAGEFSGSRRHQRVSSEIETHSKAGAIRIHHSQLNPDQSLTKSDEEINVTDQPDHHELSIRKQRIPAERHRQQRRYVRSHARCGQFLAHRAGRRRKHQNQARRRTDRIKRFCLPRA